MTVWPEIPGLRHVGIWMLLLPSTRSTLSALSRSRRINYKVAGVWGSSFAQSESKARFMEPPKKQQHFILNLTGSDCSFPSMRPMCLGKSLPRRFTIVSQVSRLIRLLCMSGVRNGVPTAEERT